MKTFALSIAAAATVIAAPASAESVQVRYSDLNLATAQGQRTLSARIHSAALKVCKVSSAHSAGPLKAGKAMRCVERAETNAVQAFAAVSRTRARAG